MLCSMGWFYWLLEYVKDFICLCKAFTEPSICSCLLLISAFQSKSKYWSSCWVGLKIKSVVCASSFEALVICSWFSFYLHFFNAQLDFWDLLLLFCFKRWFLPCLCPSNIISMSALIFVLKAVDFQYDYFFNSLLVQYLLRLAPFSIFLLSSSSICKWLLLTLFCSCISNNSWVFFFLILFSNSLF